MRGTITSWDQGAPYGHITADGSQELVLIRVSELPAALRKSNAPRKNLRVEFDIVLNDKTRPHAVNVRINE